MLRRLFTATALAAATVAAGAVLAAPAHADMCDESWPFTPAPGGEYPGGEVPWCEDTQP